jgi:hypothetical protein
MNAARMQLSVRPLLDPKRTIDLHEVFVRAIERELEQRFSGNSVLNRLEAEAQLAALLRTHRDSDESSETRENRDDTHDK